MYLTPRTYKIEVDVMNLRVGTKDWSFTYRLREAGRQGKEQFLDGTHTRTQRTMIRAFERGHAFELVMQRHF